MMKIKHLAVYILPGFILLFLFNTAALIAQARINEASPVQIFDSNVKDGPTVSIIYKDTLTLPSFTEFNLSVKMKTGSEISAISLGFYYPRDFLEITGIVLADSVQGFYYSDTNGLMIIAWSDINPINILDEGTILTISMNALDLTELIGTIKLGIYEFSEFADQSANIIEGVELEVPEIQFLVPDPIDSISGNYVSVYPNPFDDFTAINFYLKTESNVKITLCDLNGMTIYLAKETAYLKGAHQLKLYGIDLPRGLYLLKFEIGNPEGSWVKLIKIMALR